MSNSEGRGLSRRAFVGKVTAGAAGGALAVSLGARAASALSVAPDNKHEAPGEAPVAVAHSQPEMPLQVITETAPAPWEIVRPLRNGASLVGGWHLKDLSGVVGGACVLTLANDHGREQRVHLCRNDGAPRGIVYTDRFDMVAMNGGSGDLPTEESFGQSVGALAHVIAANENGRVELPGLLSQRDREERFAGAAQLR